MERKGIRFGCVGFLCLLVWILPVSAQETADDITEMLAWWDEYGRYWEEASDLIDFAGDAPLFTLAANTVETSE